MQTIMIVEDDAGIRHYLQSTLSNAGYDTVAVGDGRSALALAASHCPDCVLLDLGLPDMDGIGIIQSIRKWSSVPIIVISARMTEDDKAGALDLGADDYLTKPFDIGEFLARVRALTRRSAAKQLSGLTCGNFTLDRASMELSCGTSSVCLSSRESAMLELFIREEGRLLTETQLLEHTWGSTSYDDGASDPLPPTQEAQLVWTYVSYLRKKMQALGANRSIQRTEEGYRLTAADA